MAGKITSRVLSVYFIAGDDDYQKSNKVAEIVNKALRPQNKELNLDIIYADEPGVSDLYSKIRTVPFLSDKRVVVILNAEELADELKKQLLEYVSTPSDLTTLIIVSSNVSKKSFKENKFFQSLAELIAPVFCYTLYESQLRQWIKEKVNAYKKDIDGAAMEILIERIGNNLQEMDSEIIKTITFIGDRQRIQAEDVQLVDGLNVKDVYDLINAVADKDTTRSIKILSNMFYDKLAPFLVSALYYHFKKMWEAKFLIKQRCSEEEISKKLNINRYFIKEFLKQVNNFSEGSLRLVFSHLTKADISIKTFKLIPEVALERLIYNITLSF